MLERQLWRKLKDECKRISWTRLENWALFGTPDLLGYAPSGNFFTVELKVTQGNKVKFSPHQIAFHKSHPDNTFILLKTHGQCVLKLVPGSEIHDLRTKGHDTIFTVAEDWKGVQTTFDNIF